MNFYVVILVDGQWKEELIVHVELVDGELPLDFDHQIRKIATELFGICSWIAENAENGKGVWRW